MTTNNSVQNALASYRVAVLGAIIAVLATIIGIFVGLQIASSNNKEKIQSAVAFYSEASYRACKLQENALNGYNSQQSRRSCEYLKQVIKQ